MNTPQMVELRDSNVTLIKQMESTFLALDSNCITVFSYDGRSQSQTKYNFSLASLNTNQIAANSKYCVMTGKIGHSLDLPNYFPSNHFQL